MITPDKRIIEDSHANLTDYSVRRPKEAREFFVFITFEDNSDCLLANIFTSSRAAALAIVLERFADCNNYIKYINLYESE